MNDIKELQRLASPAPKPQSLAWDGATLWMGSRATRGIYALDVKNWTVGWQTEAPSVPFGMTSTGAELRVICGEGAEDNRVVLRCVPEQGFDPSFRIHCPDDTGSHLSYDGQALYVSQWYAKKIIALGKDGQIGPAVEVPHGIAGHTWVNGVFYCVTTDAEDTTDYWLTRVETNPDAPKAVDLARIPFAARALAFDGKNFWTNHRERNEIVSFARPD